jgi:hypothetical protein
MFSVFLFWFGALFRLFRSRRDLVFENFVLRQQLAVLKRRRPRPSLSICDSGQDGNKLLLSSRPQP